MTRKRVYLSGPITGTEDYMERFAKAEKQLTEEGFSVVNPAKVCAQLPEDTTYEEYMDVAFALLEACDAVYMLDGWEKSCGANREYGYATAAGTTVMKEMGEAGKEERYTMDQILDAIVRADGELIATIQYGDVGIVEGVLRDYINSERKENV